jgi:FixJ family two-component response regulator
MSHYCPDDHQTCISLFSKCLKIITNTAGKGALQLLSQGNSFKMIAAELGISIDTVRTHQAHL